ncbi:DUF4422 domain-containing protein [Lapidilactobacillus dextrinicus]|uniref:DUF4422 domain-containing protein n=1 Tax=Lapidilactobacillus dextrinicus TaxID=51664 RepID=UPI0022E5A53C|nr:DUF4422 domain-containing protein [Lapidilactobacillus dextrinicus]
MIMYVCSHKRFEKIIPKGYQILYVGPKKFDTSNGVTDDTGEQIAEKNSHYSELTAWYWIWKNDNSDYVGLCHYRRFFIDQQGKIMGVSKLLDILKDYDVIVPTKMRLSKSVYQNYKQYHNIKDFEKTGQIIHQLTPEYDEAFKSVCNQHWLYPLNMMVLSKQLLNQYCEWLFPILFKLESQIDISQYDSYQSRIYGFISERLFNVWLVKNQLNCIENAVDWSELSKSQKRIENLKQGILAFDSEHLHILDKSQK